MMKQIKTTQQLVAILAFLGILSIVCQCQAAAWSSLTTKNNDNINQFQENLTPEESRNDEISDDLTAADLDLDGAAASPEGDTEDSSDSDDESTEASEGRQLRWNGNGEPAGLDSNIENAKIHMTPKDMATAAGHHHHHGHYVHGWLKMGAETGKKGAFKWHDKHPVGGKGRR